MTHTPKQLRRAWLRFIADNNWSTGSEIYRQAQSVLLSIDMLILNLGREAEAWARRDLAKQLAAFSALRVNGRG